jgi:aspartate racemase
MGPEATVHLFDLIVKKTRAKKDGDHIPIIIMNNPEIPDRTAAITGDGKSPLPHLIQTSKNLERAGADFLVMPCITAHHYYQDIVNKINIPLIHMIRETINHIMIKLPGINRFGLLATTGTMKIRLFQEELEKIKSRVITPDSEQQKKVMEAIYGITGIKAGYKDFPRKTLTKTTDLLRNEGAQAIIAGCTEIALVAEEIIFDLPVINPLHILASASIKMAGYQEK